MAAAASTIQDLYRRSHTFLSTVEDITFTSMGMATTTMAITIMVETEEEMDMEMGMAMDTTMARADFKPIGCIGIAAPRGSVLVEVLASNTHKISKLEFRGKEG